MADPVHIRHGSNIGQRTTRREAALKVTGRANYAADHHPEGMLFAVMATSSIARGRIAAIDTSAALAHPGVVEVMTHANAPRLAQDPDEKNNPFAFRLDLLQNDRVRYPNQPIAVVIAESLEAATEGATLLRPSYEEAEAARVGLDGADRFVPPSVGVGEEPSTGKGDVDAGLTSAARRIEAVYETPAQYHNAMEPHAVVATWDGDTLLLDTPTQGLSIAQGRVAGLFGVDPAGIHIRSPFLGGGFGSKGAPWAPQMLGIMAARMMQRPVKLVTRRDQMYGPLGHRAPTRQTLRIGTTNDGTLTAIDHHTLTASSTFDDFFEPSSNTSHTPYSTPNLASSHEAVRLDTGTPFFMRAPGEATGSAALESAIDEMALACGMDPLAFRLRNYAEVEPISGKPFSSKALRECYEQGAARFGWSSRPLAPRSMRDDRGLLVGWGVGTAIFPAIMFQAEARAELRADGGALVEIGAHDMGQGAWTALAQIAADGLGLDIEQVEFRMGDSKLPNGGIAGGSAHTATAGAAIHEAGGAAIAALADLAMNDERSPLFGAGNAGVIAREGRLWRRDDETRGESYVDILARAGRDMVEGRGQGARDPRRAGCARDARAWRGVRRGEGRSRSRPGQGFATRRRLCRRPRHQPAHGAEPVLRRDDLGPVVRAARARRGRPAHRADDERKPRRLPRAGKRRRAVHRGDPGARGGCVRERPRHQGRGRDRHHRHGRRDRQRRLARDRDQGEAIPDPARQAARRRLTLGWWAEALQPTTHRGETRLIASDVGRPSATSTASAVATFDGSSSAAISG